MKQIEKKDIWLFAAQVAAWAVILFALPLATFISTRDTGSTMTSFLVVWGIFRAPLLVYFINFYILGPWLFFRQRRWLFFLCNLLLQKFTGSNTLSAIVSIVVAILVYCVMLLLVRGIEEEDLLRFPGGRRLASLAARLHLLRG